MSSVRSGGTDLRGDLMAVQRSVELLRTDVNAVLREAIIAGYFDTEARLIEARRSLALAAGELEAAREQL